MATTGVPGVRRVGRWLRPTGFVLAGLFMLMPFVTVSCDAPGGFGRAAPGGTTTYTGVVLLTGAAPRVSPPAKVRPQAAQRDDRLGAQPLTVAVAVLILAGIATAGLSPPLRRRATGAVIAAVAVVFLISDQVTVRALLKSRLREQLTGPMPAGKQAGDYVHDQAGFWLCLAALLAVTVANGIGWLWLRRTPHAATPESPDDPDRTLDYEILDLQQPG